MSTWRAILALMPVILAATGCSVFGPIEPSQEQIASADYGPEPTEQEAVEAIRFHSRVVRQFEGTPYRSLKIEHDSPQQAWVGQRGVVSKEDDYRFGWRVNARISSDSYVLERSFLLQKRPHGFGVLAMAQGGRWWFAGVSELNRELASKGPETQELAAADVGAKPERYEAPLSQLIRSQLKDPESARIRFDVPRPTWGREADRPGTQYGWSVTAFVNAKNSYGGYVGEKPWSFMLRDGRLMSATRLGSGFELGASAAPLR